MQYTNNQPVNNAGQQDSKQKKKLIIIGGVVLLVIIVLIFQLGGGSKKPASDRGTYYDVASGETISNPDNKDPEHSESQSLTPTYLGFSKLLTVGITQDQLDGIKLGFSRYPALQDKDTPREVSIYVDTVVANSADIDSDFNTVTFDIIVNRQTKLFATVQYSGLSDIQLLLKNRSGGSTVFDSGVINEDSLTDEHEHGD